MRALVAAAVAAAVVSPVPAAVAAPPADGPVARKCNYGAFADPRPSAPDDQMIANVSAGPLLGDGTLVCTMVRNANRHDAAVVSWSEEQPSVGGVAVMPARTVEWVSPVDDQEYLCTSWREPGGTELYWYPGEEYKGPWRDEPGYWTTDPTVRCQHSSNLGPFPPPWFFDLVEFGLEQVEPHLCPALQGWHSGPYDPQQPYHVYVDDDGDVYLDDDGDGRIQDDEVWWDCPPRHSGGYSTWPDPADPLG